MLGHRRRTTAEEPMILLRQGLCSICTASVAKSRMRICIHTTGVQSAHLWMR